MTTEREFNISDLFFSTTDLSGKIKFGNRVFAQISAYSLEEMVGRPHSMIRHEDMPRVVFRLLWDSIQQGKPIGAFVKNRAKDGAFYWVFAYVVRLGDVYLSVRFKPSGQCFSVIKQVYEELLQVEKEIESQFGATKEEAIQASNRRLTDLLQKLGFSDYESFIRVAMVDEYLSRERLKQEARQSVDSGSANAELQRISSYLYGVISTREEFSSVATKIDSCTKTVAELTEKIQLAALNLIVKSKREQKLGEPLAVVSNWLQTGAVTLQQKLTAVVEPIKHEISQLQVIIFKMVATRLQVEMMEIFLRELRSGRPADSGINVDQVAQAVELLSHNCQDNIQGSLGEIETLIGVLRGVHATFSELQRDVVSLSLAQVNGLTECCRLSDAESFSVILGAVIKEILHARGTLDEVEFSLDGMVNQLHTHDQKRALVSKWCEDFASSLPITLRDLSVAHSRSIEPLQDLQSIIGTEITL